MDLPEWATPDVMTRLKQLKDFGFEFLFGIQDRVEKARLQGGECTRRDLHAALSSFSLLVAVPFPQGSCWVT